MVMIKTPIRNGIASCLLTSCVTFAATVSSEPDVKDMEPLDCVINPSVVADLGSGVPGILSDISVDRYHLAAELEIEGAG
mgnify:CR=1 FL=1